jgi:cytochrome c5
MFFVSCYYDNEEALYPSLNSSCDTTNVTFSGTIVPILQNNCYSCHSNANAAFGANIHLEAYADVVANSAKLIVSIKQTGAKPMPPNGKLKDCSITQFDIWIRKGMLNN